MLTTPHAPAGQLGRGLYLPAEAARLAQVDADRVRRWVRGYDHTNPRTGERKHSPPLFPRERSDSSGRLLLTFLDLIEVCFVREFLKHGVSIHLVRKVQAEAQREFRVAHPFCVKRFETDGETIVERVRDAEGVERIFDRGVTADRLMAEVFNPLLRTLDYEGIAQEAQRWWPLGKAVPVVVDPERSSGEAIVSRAHVPTRVLFAAHAAGEPDERIAKWYGVSVEEVRAAIEFEQSRTPARPAA